MARSASSKTSFRTLLRENGVKHPEFAICRSVQDVWLFSEQGSRKIVIKPDDSSGSRGVVVLERDHTEESLAAAWRKTIHFSRNGLVCAEFFLPGTEVGGDAFFKDGKLHFFAITKKHLAGVMVRGHSFPARLSPLESQAIENEISRVAKALGYLNGPMNFDAILNENCATVLEVGLRSGGNGIPDIIFHSRGGRSADLGAGECS